MVKNTDIKTLMFIFPLRVFFDFLSGIFYLLVYPRNVIFLINSYLSFFKNLPKYLRIRRNNSFKGPFSPDFPIFKGSVVLEYYLKNRKLFSELMNEK